MEKIEYKDYTIRIIPDEDPMDPRIDFDNAGTMVCWHSRYNLGDVEIVARRERPISKNYNEPIDLLYELAGFDRETVQQANYIKGILGNYITWKENKGIEDEETIQESDITDFIELFLDNIHETRDEPHKEGWAHNIWKFMDSEDYDAACVHEDMKIADLYKLIEEKGTIIRTLGLLDHSGLHIYIGGRSHWSDPGGWDSGPVGYIYMTKETQEKEGWTSEQVNSYLEGEVETYDDYLRGNVYGFKIEDSEGEELESCYGFYGDPEEKGGCIDEDKSVIDHQVLRDQEEWSKQPKKRAAEFYTI